MQRLAISVLVPAFNEEASIGETVDRVKAVLDGLGAVGEGYHSDREYIFAESLEERKRLVAALLKNW